MELLAASNVDPAINNSGNEKQMVSRLSTRGHRVERRQGICLSVASIKDELLYTLFHLFEQALARKS